MSPLLVLTGIGFAAVFGYAFRDTAKFQKVLRRAGAAGSKTRILEAVEKLLICAQLVEIAKSIEHAGVLNIVITLAMFGLWLALKTGTEDETGKYIKP